jgi:hypothetical protein
MKRLFVMGIVLSMIAAGALGSSLSTSSIVDAKKNNQQPDTGERIVNIIKSIKARILENDETQRGVDKKDIWKREAGQTTDRNSNPFPFTKN